MQTIGRNFTLDSKGIATFNVPFYTDSDEELLTLGRGTGPLGMAEVDRKAEEGNDGSWLLTITYQGKASYAAFEHSYTLDTATSEESIETHPDFLALVLKYEGKFSPSDKTKFLGFPQKLKNKAGKEIKNPLFGVTAYKEKHLVWSHSFTAPTLPKSLTASVGSIDKPTGTGSAIPPEIPDEGNWLKDSVTASFKGNIWSITEKWIGSGRGGFSEDIYRRK